MHTLKLDTALQFYLAVSHLPPEVTANIMKLFAWAISILDTWCEPWPLSWTWHGEFNSWQIHSGLHGAFVDCMKRKLHITLMTTLVLILLIWNTVLKLCYYTYHAVAWWNDVLFTPTAIFGKSKYCQAFYIIFYRCIEIIHYHQLSNIIFNSLSSIK